MKYSITKKKWTICVQNYLKLSRDKKYRRTSLPLENAEFKDNE